MSLMGNRITLIEGKRNRISRFSVMQLAYQTGISGFVERSDNGEIIIEAEGEEENFERFIKKLNGPPVWFISGELKVDEIPVSGFSAFDIRK